MTNMKFRIIINAIALGFVTYSLVSKFGSDVMPLNFALFAMSVFGCALSLIDYAREKSND